MVEIDVVQVGVLATNCYFIHSSGESDCVVIDPGGEPARIIEYLEVKELSPGIILSTHAHADHTGAVSPLVDRYDSQFMIGAGDVAAASEQLYWLRSMLGDFMEPPEPTRVLHHGDSIVASGFEIGVLSTPGHTNGSCSFVVDGHVFTGDTLFLESIGRFDLSDGDEHLEIASIKSVLFALDEATIVLPGHGPSTTIGHEKVANRFVQ